MPARRFDQAIVVLGTHRSGTSALTGLLGKCGLGMPRTLIPPASSNERGLWESEPIKSLNDDVLHALGQSWYDLAEFNSAELKRAKFRAERQRAEQLLVQEFDAATTPVIKDPRLCRLLPLWKPPLGKLAGRTSYAFIVRSPLESAQSLVARNDFDLDFGLMLWARYLLDGELHTRGETRAFATYSKLLDDWRDVVTSFSTKLAWGQQCDAITSSSADDFISRDLRHHHVPDPELEREIERIQLISEVWHTLAGWAEGASETPADYKLLDGARERLGYAGELLARQFNESRLQRKRRNSALAKAEQLTVELAQAQRALEDIASLRQVLETASKELSERQEHWFDQMRTRLDRDHEKLQSRLAGIGETLQQREHLERSLSEALSEQAALRIALEQQQTELAGIGETLRQREHLERSLSEALSEQAALRIALEQQQTELAGIGETLRQREHLERSLSEALSEQAALRIALEQQQTELAGIGETLRQREHLERSLSEALSEQAALRIALEQQQTEADSKLEQLDAQRSAERQDLENRIRKEEEDARRATQRAELAEGALSERERKLAELELLADQTRRKYRATQAILAREKVNSEKLELQLAEADRTKRKYRAAQSMLAREQGNSEKLKRRLAAAQKELEEAHERLGWRVQETVEGWSRQFSRAINLRRRERRKHRADLELVRSSDLFDASWYLEQYPDVAQSGKDPAEHFVTLGWREARSPSAAFSVTRYLKKHADIAAMGINPLIHYLEHGQFEGREIQPTGVVSAVPRNVMPAAPAARWASFELPQEQRAVWARACMLDSGDPRAILIDELAVGFESDSCPRSAIEETVANLEALSGVAGKPYASSLDLPGIPGLADGWFVARNRLSSRWQVEDATVIRAVQCDVFRGGRPTLVGEGLATDPLDVIDLDLVNPLFPLLIIAAAPAGDIIGTSTLAFPSLLRGGVHYSELIDLAGMEAPSPLEISNRLEGKLRAIRCSKAQPLIKSLAVDLRAADGTGPLFQSGVAAWLALVAGVDVAPAEAAAADEGAAAYLAEAVSKKSAHPRRSGGTLRLGADMLPAISALVEHARKNSASRECAMAVIVAEQDCSQPSTRFDPPDTKASFGDIESSSYPPAFPRMRGRDARPMLAAVRTLQNPLKEAELLRPDNALEVSYRTADQQVAWVVPIDSSDSELAGESLLSLAEQDGSSSFLIFLVGPGAGAALPAAKHLFGDRVSAVESIEHLAMSPNTACVGYLGSGIILHDARTYRLLNHLIEDDATASASCVLVNSEKRGKGWHVAPVDAGVIPIDRAVVHGAATAHESSMLWRSVFPVIEPPRQLWLARRESVLRWQAGETAAKEMHLVTTLVSASASMPIEEVAPLLAPYPTGKRWAIGAKVLVG